MGWGATWFKGLLPGWNVKIATDEGLLFSHTSAEHLDILRTQKSSLNPTLYLWMEFDPEKPGMSSWSTPGQSGGVGNRCGRQRRVTAFAPQSNLKWSSMLAPFCGWCYLLKLSVGKDQNDLLTTQSFYSQWSEDARSAWEVRVRQVQHCCSVQPLPFEFLLGLEVGVLSTWWSERKRWIVK